MLLIGLVLFGTTQFIPQLLQEVLGYTATEAGEALTVGGIATILMMPVAGMLSGRVDARVSARRRPGDPGVRLLEYERTGHRHEFP